MYSTICAVPCVQYQYGQCHLYCTICTVPSVQYHLYSPICTVPCVQYYLYCTIGTVPYIQYHTTYVSCRLKAAFARASRRASPAQAAGAPGHVSGTPHPPSAVVYHIHPVYHMPSAHDARGRRGLQTGQREQACLVGAGLRKHGAHCSSSSREGRRARRAASRGTLSSRRSKGSPRLRCRSRAVPGRHS